jgi:hypothetical protein
VGAVILFGWLIATAIVVIVLVLRLDPQAKLDSGEDRS